MEIGDRTSHVKLEINENNTYIPDYILIYGAKTRVYNVPTKFFTGRNGWRERYEKGSKSVTLTNIIGAVKHTCPLFPLLTKKCIHKTKNPFLYSLRPTRFFTVSFLGCPIQFFTFQNLPNIVNGSHHFPTFPPFSHYFYSLFTLLLLHYLSFIH